MAGAPGAAHPVGPGLLDWLERLDTATASRRSRTTAAADASGAPAVEMLLDGLPVHRLRLDAATVRWETMPGDAAGSWQASLGNAESVVLRDTLAQAGRSGSAAWPTIRMRPGRR